MSSVKSQVKWVVKHFSSLILILFVATAGVAYFTNRLSSSNFNTIALIVVSIVLVLVYYGLINLRSGLVFALLAVLLVVGVKFSKHPTVKSGQFQAVHLVGGGVYFGHLKNADSATPTLTDVYFLRAAPQQTTTSTTPATSTAPVLVKLSSDIYSPEDSMIIKADQIISWENLQDSGKVVQAINKDLKK